MKNGLVIADAGPIFSLAVIDKLELLSQLFNEINIPNAVWEEITLNKTTLFYNTIESFFHSKVVNIKGTNELTFVMDYGESESVILFKELNADFLLIDDKKARSIAESIDITCIGTLGVLVTAKNRGLISSLKPIFQKLLDNDRYYSIKLLNTLLVKNNEELLNSQSLK